ncbi:MAG: YbjN domain-containing protein, partial [Myxococcales bacterium]|nr:YbjN domain-containing protein [Myxococcales bacterium]
LERNRRLFGIAYAIDQLGDIYLVGRIPAAAVSEQLLDQVLGAVLSEADGSFNIILELGFRSSIEKEWRWRLSRGESTANLAAFEHLRPGQG